MFVFRQSNIEPYNLYRKSDGNCADGCQRPQQDVFLCGFQFIVPYLQAASSAADPLKKTALLQPVAWAAPGELMAASVNASMALFRVASVSAT
jgi:hypothetical protein